MKLLQGFALICIILMTSGCLTYQIYEVTAVFNDDFSRAAVTATYTDIRSSEKDSVKQREDFDDLIKKYQEDDFLLEEVGSGIYVKERRIFEKNGQINASYSGVFKQVEPLKVKGDERYILLEDVDPGDKIESNGKVLRSKEIALLVWPKELKKISYKVTKAWDKPTYSLLHFYNEWLKK